MHDTRKSGSFPNSKKVGNIFAGSKVNTVNTDLIINSNKDEGRKLSDNVNPSESADKSSVLRIH